MGAASLCVLGAVGASQVTLARYREQLAGELEGAVLLLVEMVLAHGDTPHPGKILDMIMLVGPGGQERTEDEYRELYKKAGFRLTRVVPTASPVSVVEGVPV